MAKFLQGKTKGSHVFAILEKGSEFGFGDRQNNMFDDGEKSENGPISRGSAISG